MIAAEALRALLEQAAGRAVGPFEDGTPLAEGLRFDSVAFLELAVVLEERLGVTVSAADVGEGFKTVESLRRLIGARGPQEP